LDSCTRQLKLAALQLELLDLELTTEEDKPPPPQPPEEEEEEEEEEEDSTAPFSELSLLWSLSLGHETLLAAFAASPSKPAVPDHPKPPSQEIPPDRGRAFNSRVALPGMLETARLSQPKFGFLM
jgi:hypothetical protein